MSKKTNKIDDISTELKSLIPKIETIVIGSEMYQISELVFNQYEKLIDTVAAMIVSIYQNLRDDSPDAVIMTESVKVITADIVPILNVITGIPEEEIRDKITAPQIAYAAKIIWSMNGIETLRWIGALQDSVNNSLDEFGFTDSPTADGEDDTSGTPLE